MSSKFNTLQRILPGCEAGDRAAWETFLAQYTPLAYALSSFYLGARSGKEQAVLWAAALRALGANDFERLRGLAHHAEREFLADLRAFLLEFGAPNLRPYRNAASVPALTPEAVADLLKDLPLVQKEIVFFKLAGYSDATLEKILVLPAVAIRNPLEKLAKNDGLILDQEDDACPWPAAWLEILRHAHASRCEDCPPRRVWVRILDGQTTWYEKSPAEEHMAHCLHCLESWVALREVTYLRRVTAPLSLPEIEPFLATLPIGMVASPSLFRRLLSR